MRSARGLFFSCYVLPPGGAACYGAAWFLDDRGEQLAVFQGANHIPESNRKALKGGWEDYATYQ